MARLEGLLAKALASDAVKARFAMLNVAPVVMTRQATGQFLRAEGARYGAVIKARGIKPE
jgi:tripartite-type tricarboxylate transporter receptor subunit TctC